MNRTGHHTRRALLRGLLALTSWLALHAAAWAESGAFQRWVAAFRDRALARGISAKTYDSVMGHLQPDTSVYALLRSQPEFQELTWQYLNRRVSDWRITTGKDVAKQHSDLLGRIEKEYGVDRYLLVALWGVESAYGDPMVQQKYMRPVFPALAALAWNAPRRRAYWQQELLNALVIVDRGWSTPKEMIGSWAGAMGHTQWMPEVWLHVGLDFDHDGRVSPFGSPADALAGTALYLVKRGGYRKNEHWGYEVTGLSRSRGSRTYADWAAAGVKRADGKTFPLPHARARAWVPVPGGPAFLIGANFFSVKSYNPSMNYALAIAHLSDRLSGGGPFVRSFPGGERAPTQAELKELQERLAKAGFDPGGQDGRVGADTMKAVRAYQRKVGMEPTDGYAGIKVLERLRHGS